MERERLHEAYFLTSIHHGGGKSDRVVDNGEGVLRIERVGWDAILVTPKRGKVAEVPWSQVRYSHPWRGCDVKGCRLYEDHREKGLLEHKGEDGQPLGAGCVHSQKHPGASCEQYEAAMKAKGRPA